MKRFVLNCVLLCLVAGSVMFVSCGDNEIGDSASWLVGTWATSMIMEEAPEEGVDDDLFVLHKDGTCDWEDSHGVWSYKNGKLTVVCNDEGDHYMYEFYVENKSGSMFTFRCLLTENGETYHYYGTAYKR